VSEELPNPERDRDERLHPLRRFVQQSAEQIAAEYERIAADALEDPGTAGDEGGRIGRISCATGYRTGTT
jgi:hypothetical protein